MTKKIIRISGIAAIVFALVANLQYALFNYGLKNHSIGLAVMAQTSTSSGGGTTTGGGTTDDSDPWVTTMPSDIDDSEDDSGDYSNDTSVGLSGTGYQLVQVRCIKVGFVIQLPIKNSQLQIALGYRMKCKKMAEVTCDGTKVTPCS